MQKNTEKPKTVKITAEDIKLRKAHRKRLKARFCSQVKTGRDEMEDNRMLELLLTYALPQKDVYPLANILLAKFGSLDEIFAADIEALVAVTGIKEHTALLLKLVPALNRRRAVSRSEQKYYREEKDIVELLRGRFCEAREELVVAALFSARGRLIVCDTVSVGTSQSCPVDVAKLTALLGQQGAKYLVIAHNHPSGNVSPSAQDMQVLTVIESITAMTQTTLLEAYVFAGDEYVSLIKAKNAVDKVRIDYGEDTVSYIFGEGLDDTDEAIIEKHR